MLRGPGAELDWAGPSEPLPSVKTNTYKDLKYCRACGFTNPYGLTGRVNKRHLACMCDQYRVRQVSSASEHGEE